MTFLINVSVHFPALNLVRGLSFSLSYLVLPVDQFVFYHLIFALDTEHLKLSVLGCFYCSDTLSNRFSTIISRFCFCFDRVTFFLSSDMFHSFVSLFDAVFVISYLRVRFPFLYSALNYCYSGSRPRKFILPVWHIFWT